MNALIESGENVDEHSILIAHKLKQTIAEYTSADNDNSVFIKNAIPSLDCNFADPRFEYPQIAGSVSIQI